MRIIAGTFGGRQLSTTRDHSIRPTTDRAKQVIFDILNNRIDFDGIHVLDLFAGSGSLGLEAISRGAAHTTFVESSRTSIAVLEENIRRLGCSGQASVQQADVFWTLKHTHRTFDLVFVDPPYRLPKISELPLAIAASRVVRPGSLVVMEYSRETPMSVPESSFEITTKQLGQTTVLIMTMLERPDSDQEGTVS